MTTSRTTITLPAHTRYKDTLVVARSTGIREFGLWNSDDTLTRNDGVTLHTVTNGDIGRLDRLSYTYYGTVEYAWIIAHANHMINPIADMYAGQRIKIPTLASVNTYLNRAAYKQ